MLNNTISILLLPGGGVPVGEVVDEKRIPYRYDSQVFLALPTTRPK